MIDKNEEFCTAYDCLIITCSKHRVHVPKVYKIPLVWTDYHKLGCKMYVSKENWRNM